MRILDILMGLPASGKSTWVKNNKLENYAVSSDDIRLLYSSTVYDINGKEGISQDRDKKVWDTLYEILRDRMERGEYTIVDATNLNKRTLLRYRNLAEEFRYRVNIVDFTNIPLETILERNNQRPVHKQVPENIIQTMYENMLNKEKVGSATYLDPNKYTGPTYGTHNFSDYEKIVHIGDIHGCYDVLTKYFDEHPFSERNVYIFLGDYIDRGIQNREVLEFIYSIRNKDNVILLEGNHERHLIRYLNGEAFSERNRFSADTLPQIINMDKSKLREVVRKLSQVIKYTYNGQDVVASHGGISNIRDLALMSTETFVKGTGRYEELPQVYETWAKLHPKIFQVHGHRNLANYPIKASYNAFNLEGGVEFGGHLRIVELSKDGWTPIEIKNDIFNEEAMVADNSLRGVNTVKDLVKVLRKSSLVKEKEFNNISSFSFTTKAFEDRKWNSVSELARGLFIDTKKNKIVLRSWKKFFNLDEKRETTLEHMKNSLKFPVVAYEKVNGFLGLLSWDFDKDDFIFASKSSLDGEHAKLFEQIFRDKMSKKALEKARDYLQRNKVTMLFEVVDLKNDPHIIDEAQNDLYQNIVLLDIVYNEIKFSKLPYDKLKSTADYLGLRLKETYKKYEMFEPMAKDIEKFEQDCTIKHLEGFVFEDSNGFHFKLKLPYYSFWKNIRSALGSYLKGKEPRMYHPQYAEVVKEFFSSIKREVESGRAVEPDKIIELRNEYIKRGGKDIE